MITPVIVDVYYLNGSTASKSFSIIKKATMTRSKRALWYNFKNCVLVNYKFPFLCHGFIY